MEKQEIDARFSGLRRKLMLGLPGSLALASPLALVACGGGGSDSPDSATAEPTTTLPPVERSTLGLKMSLPAGSGVSLQDCRLMTGNNVSQVAADGTAGAVLLRGEPQMGYLVAADGRLLLMGVVEAGRTAINSRTTAEALVFIASEVALLDPALQVALRKVLQTHAVVEPVRVAVEAAIRRGGISDQDAELVAALIAAESIIRPRTPAGAAESRARAQQLTIAPADAVSGVTVNRDAAFNTVVLENGFRRRAHAWVERVGYFDSNGTEVSLAGPELLSDFDVSATTALSFDNIVIKVGDFLADLAADIGLIGRNQEGTAPFSAIRSAPIYLPIRPEDAQSSLYRARVVGVGLTPAQSLTSEERNKLDELVVATAWEDIVVPIMQTLVLPLISDRLGKLFQAEVKSLWLATIGVDLVNIAVLTPLLPNTLERVQQGDAGGAFGAFWKEFFSSNTWQDLLKHSLNSLLIASVGADQGGPVVRDAAGNIVAVNLLGTELPGKVAQFQASLGKVAKIVVLIKAAATIVDFAAMTKDWAASQQRSEFALASSGTTISFTPAAVSATAGQSVPLTAVLGETADLAAGSVIRYEWSVSGSAGGSLRNPANQSSGATLSTSTNTVDYVAAAGAAAGATDQVKVKAVLTDIGTQGGGVVAVSKVPAVVTISAVRLTPPSVNFKQNEAGQRQEFTVEFSSGFGSAVGLVYEWSCASVQGTLSDNTLISSSATPTFRSALPKATYSSFGTSLGGENELVQVRVLRITSAPGAVTETTETVATLQSSVSFGKFTVEMPALPAEMPTNSSIAVTARLVELLPAGATVVWTWSHTGAGSIATSDASPQQTSSSVLFSTGATEGAAQFSVSARVVQANNAVVTTPPATRSTQVKQGLRTITLEGYWVVEPGSKPIDPSCFTDGAGKLACQLGYLDTWITYVLPKVSNALQYQFNIYAPNGSLRVSLTLPHPNIVDGGNVWRWRYWGADGPYGSYDGVSNYEKTQADAIAYLVSRATNEGSRVAAVVTLKP